MQIYRYIQLAGLVALTGLGMGSMATIRAAENASEAALARISEDVRYLASDELEGRGPGTSGIHKAAEYIRQEFQEAGLESGVADGSYLQPFTVPLGESVLVDQTRLVLSNDAGTRLELEVDQGFRPFYTGEKLACNAPLVFVGYGISAPDLGYDDYRDLNVEGKIVVMIRREPQQGDAESKFDGEKTTSHAYFATKIKQARDHKAAGVLLVNDPYTTKKSAQDDLIAQQGLGVRDAGIPFAQLTLETMNALLAASPLVTDDGQSLQTLEAVEFYIDKNFKSLSQPLGQWTADIEFAFKEEQAETANVIGVLKGAGPLAHEAIVVGAHYDHLGYGGFGSRKPNSNAIHNGADDNASGTAAVIELARRLATRDGQPARQIVFVAFSGEERGLIGSSHYVKNPVVPLEQTVAMLNFDMVGNLRNAELGVHGTGSGRGLADVVSAVAADSPLTIKQGDGVISASDHFSFYQRKVPVVFFFTGLTDIYHTPEDDYETLNLPGLEQVATFAAEMCWSVAAMSERPEYVEVAVSSPSRGGMAYLGVVPDYGAQAAGLPITAVKTGSPAEQGGLKNGDIITRIGEVKVADIEGLAEGLRKYKPGQTVEIAYKREDMELTSTVVLGEPGSK